MRPISGDEIAPVSATNGLHISHDRYHRIAAERLIGESVAFGGGFVAGAQRFDPCPAPRGPRPAWRNDRPIQGVGLPLAREAMTFAGAVRVTTVQAAVQCSTGPKTATAARGRRNPLRLTVIMGASVGRHRICPPLLRSTQHRGRERPAGAGRSPPIILRRWRGSDRDWGPSQPHFISPMATLEPMSSATPMPRPGKRAIIAALSAAESLALASSSSKAVR